MKKLAKSLVLGVLALSLAACGKSSIPGAPGTKDSGKKQHRKACVRCVVGTVTGYMDLRTGDEIKPIFDMDFGCDQRAYAGCRDPALWPQDKCSV